jgi:subtilase family serine protease
MLRRFVIALSVVSLLGAFSMTQAGAKAGPRPAVVHSKRVCGISYSSVYAQCFARVVTDAKGHPLNVNPDVSGYGPSQFHSGYNLPTTVAGKHTIAIVDAFNQPNIFNDLNVYNAQFGLPAIKKCKKNKQTNCLAILNQNGGTSPLPPNDTGWGLEISLDVEIARAICQNCRINLYEATSNSFGNLATAVNTAAATKRVVAISNSYGSFLFDCTTQPAYNHPKIAVTVSTGDSGFGVACPANQNSVVAVGGTHLVLTGGGAWSSESVWNGGGSGCSTVINAQSFQTTATNWAAIGCGTKRGMADVSADADPATGAAVYDSFGAGGWNVVGGTSLSSPLIASVYALANNVGNWNYPAQSVYQSPGSLHDITTGSNGSGGTCTAHPLQCHAGAGYDLPTGIGTPNGLGGF